MKTNLASPDTQRATDTLRTAAGEKLPVLRCRAPRHVRWQVVEIDLAEKLPQLELAPDFAGVRVVYRLDGRPVGHSDFTAAQLPLSPVQLAVAAARQSAAAIGDRLFDEGFQSALPGLPEPEIEDPCHTLDRLMHQTRPLGRFAEIVRNEAAPARLPSISVAVCTRNRPAELERCLQSLQRLTDAADEIVVIDNAPDGDATRSVVARFPGVRYFPESRAGLSAARNTALKSASSEVVAFTDDDVIVDPQWIRHLRRAFADAQTMVVTGLVLPAELETRAQLIFERKLAYFHLGYRERIFDQVWFNSLKDKGVHSWEVGAGANMAIRREAYRLGYQFDTRLGPGVFGGCGEDSEYWYRLLANGWRCVYHPAAIVYHHHRRDLKALRSLMKQYMKGHVASLLLQYRKFGHRGNLRRLLVGLPVNYALALLRTIAGGFALEDRIEVYGLLGAISGLSFVFAGKDESR
jgi:GT2 family glycosyltransferase